MTSFATRPARSGAAATTSALPHALARRWYVSRTCLRTAGRKKASVEPARPLFRGAIGAVELAGRIEQLHSSSDGASGTFTTPRSPLIAPQTDNVWTPGVNRYLNDYFKVQANLIREQRTLNGQPIAALE